MKFNKDSNIFTFLFATIMCVVVAGLLSVLDSGLKKDIKLNQSAKKQINILSAINIDSDRSDVMKLFNEYIVGAVVINADGEKIDTLNSIEDALLVDIKKQYRDKSLDIKDKKFPLFIAKKDSQTYYITPVIGTGLWGPIWGFLGFKDDGNTIYGASFDHKTETPGLGAEIRETFFEETFIDKKILKNGEFVSIEVVKGGVKDPMHQVDGITGGTITSDGVTDMLKENVVIYDKYFKKLIKE